MTYSFTEETPPARAPAPRALIILLGLLFTIPAFAWGIFSLVQPTIQTMQLSVQNYNPLRASGPAQDVGLANFNSVFADPSFGNAARFTLLLIAGKLLAVSLVPPLIGWALARFGRGTHIAIRLLFCLPLALFAPLITYIAWSLIFNPSLMLMRQITQPSPLVSPTNAPIALLLIDMLMTFGIALALGVIAYVTAFRPVREGEARHGGWKGFVVLWLIGAALAIGTTLQSLDPSFTLTAGGPGNSTATLPLQYYRTLFQNLRFGPAAVYSIVSLIILGILGLLVGGAVLFTNAALLDLKPQKPPRTGRALPFIVLLLALFVMIAVLFAIFAPLQFASINGNSRPQGLLGDRPLDASLIGIAGPVLAGVLLQLPIIYLAALGIGALRPLGCASEALLLLFSPFLFVTIFPLSASWYIKTRELGILNSPQALALSSGLLNVGMLFILTLFFKGQTLRQPSGSGFGGFIRWVIVPSLSLVLLLACVGVGIGLQDAYWPLIVTTERNTFTWTNVLRSSLGQFSTEVGPLGALLTQYTIRFFLLYLIPLVLFILFYLDRLVLGSRRDLREALATPIIQEPEVYVPPANLRYTER